ncbi:helix-turn-helix transcriptional regulator [Sphingobium chlorophenolicum]|uniref:helix-turn-helix transcriptional regulator n=1 Tax=Sphingobium chlorophenolicum TaxID=46429 RepID=UPI0009DB63CB|nr:helix-turn-helix transcriptional regulator [Sphingobium chlorophenolicum]
MRRNFYALGPSSPTLRSLTAGVNWGLIVRRTLHETASSVRLNPASVALDLAQHFGAAIRRHRETLRLSQEELADRAGLDRSYLGRIERSEQNATLASAQKLADAVGSDLDVIFATARQIALGAGQR